MRCNHCDYRLWNIRSRRCPECGNPFVPSEFEFVINSVRFACPHCDQSYYGTGNYGHLVPVKFDCVSCGRPIHMDEMVLFPAAGVEEEQTNVEESPWLHRRRRGPIKAWFATLRMALITPGRLMQITPRDSSVAQAWWFAIFNTMLIVIVGVLPIILMPLIVGTILGRGTGGMPAGIAIGLCIGVVSAIAAGSAFIALWGVVAHGILLLTGRTRGTLGRTYHALCYSSGANVTSAIPCAGPYFGWIWWVISATLMVKEAQGVRGGRATLAVTALPVLLVVAVVGGYSWIFATAFKSTTSVTTVRISQTSQTYAVLEAVLDFAEAHSRRGPEHAIQLIADDYLATDDLISPQFATRDADVPVGDINLDLFDALSASRRRSIAQSAVEALPEGTIAHRLGDFVFVHHGLNLPSRDPRLWIVIQSPDPDANAPTSFDMITLGWADGNVMQIPAGALAVELAKQNEIRARYDLEPLPDPRKVTHAKPAVSGDG